MVEQVGDLLARDTCDENLFCLHCGYNLRGLAGDPIKCPECGHDNFPEACRIPGATVAELMRPLETMSTVCVACMWCFAGGLLLIWYRAYPCALVLIIPAVSVWAMTVRAFGHYTMFRPKWGHVLGWYHLAGLTWAIMVSGATWLFLMIDNRYSHETAIVLLGASVLGWLAVRPALKSANDEEGIQGIYTRAKAKLQSFCRDLLADPVIIRRMREERESRERVVGGVHVPPTERETRCAANSDAVEVDRG